MSVECPNCEAENPESQRFCGNCGARLFSQKDLSEVTKTLQTPPPLSEKTIAGKYKIIEEIGRGGMGVVYKAKDTKLKRHVALKFLPAELTQNKMAKARFIQEAQAAAALDHPNICMVHEVDEFEDLTFISMSFIEGQSLKDKLESGPLDIDKAKDIILQVAEGLKEAHEKGIVHRDIKPANIMLTKKGQAKIMDFGVAKLSWGIDLTKTSTIIGTVAYMSPEQARGEDVDHRSDIWSLGAMFYEMLTGERPFHKDHEQALIFSILNDKPTSASTLRSEVPSDYERIIEKALEKDLSKRFQIVEEFIKALKSHLLVSSAKDEKSIAVLPFTNMSADPDSVKEIESQTSSSNIYPSKQEKSIVVLPFDDVSPDKDNEYFSDGLTEEIISDLSKIQALRVISRTSAMRLKGTDKSMLTIARELDINYVLEGSVRKAGNDLRITAQLIEASNDAHLWSEKYSGTLDDIFDIQEKVARSIVDALRLKLSPEEKKEISEHLIDNVKAYECYLRARHEYWRLTRESLERGLQHLQKGLEIVGENELLYSAMGILNWQYINGGIDPDERFLHEVEKYAEKVFAINPESPHGHRLMGAIYHQRGEIIEAVKAYKRSLEFDPNNPDTLLEISRIYIGAGKTSEAKTYVERLLGIDPFTPINHCMPGYIAFADGRFDHDDMISYHRRMFTMDPKSPIGRWFHAWSLSWNRRYDEAYKIIDTLVKESPQTIYAQIGLFWKFALQGKKYEALRVVTPEMTAIARSTDFLSRDMAHGYAILNEKETALDWLENTVNRGFINYPLINEYDYLFDNLRSEPRFKKLMERVKHEWENFEV